MAKVANQLGSLNNQPVQLHHYIRNSIPLVLIYAAQSCQQAHQFDPIQDGEVTGSDSIEIISSIESDPFDFAVNQFMGVQYFCVYREVVYVCK